MAVTIKDVAKLANVAPSTVSRVIANSPRISEKTKIKVREVMQQLGYHPNYNARSLASQSTRAIGLVMPSSTDIVSQNPFYPIVLGGLSEGAQSKKYALYMTTGKNDGEILDGVISMIQGGRVDGVIMLTSKIEDQVLSYLREQKFPFVVIGKPFKDEEMITHVDNDNYRAAKDVTNYLLSLGHKQIAFIGGNLNLVVTVDRLLGYERALRDVGLPLVNDYIIHDEFLLEGGREAVQALLSLERLPTAMLVADDLMALGVLKALDEMGISVPDDISIVSFNNVLIAEMARPPLTSVDINIFELGIEAAKSLIEKIENPNEPPKRIIIPYELVNRMSCSAPRTEKKPQLLKAPL